MELSEILRRSILFALGVALCLGLRDHCRTRRTGSSRCKRLSVMKGQAFSEGTLSRGYLWW